MFFIKHVQNLDESFVSIQLAHLLSGSKFFTEEVPEMQTSSRPWKDPKLVQQHQADLTAYFARKNSMNESLENISKPEAGFSSVDLLFISAQDSFLSEYTPPENNPRTWVSGFTGSTGDGLFLVHPALVAHSQASFFLCVDGRYHLQADLECPRHLVEVCKVGQSAEAETSLKKQIEVYCNLMKSVEDRKLILGFDARRTSMAFAETLKKWTDELGFTLHPFLENEPSFAMNLPGWRTQKPVHPVTFDYLGRSPKTLNAVITKGQHLGKELSGIEPGDNPCVATTASDDAAFLLCARGYHLPFSSSILAYTFSSSQKCVVFLPEESKSCEVNFASDSGLEIQIVRSDLAELYHVLAAQKLTSFHYQGSRTNAFVPSFLSKNFAAIEQSHKFTMLEKCRAQKTPQEIEEFKRINLCSSRAISKTLRFAKSNHASLNELSLTQELFKNYQAEGCLELSFRTISGTGPNGAIVHYGTPSAQNQLSKGEITLLDSGAYYASGLATDCTRVFFNAPEKTASPAPWQKEIYTLTLKAFIGGMTAVFKKETLGKEIDALVRAPLVEKSYNYAHGTGHGVGILVHEPGVRISPLAEYPLPENAVVSMEPGCYLEGKGGVRIENVVVVKKHTTLADHLEFENLIWVGFDWDLIDVAILSEREKSWLKSYEDRCQELGTTVTTCQL